MALGDPYATLAELKEYMKIPVDKVGMDTMLSSALASASVEIDAHCSRQFNKQIGATPRVFMTADTGLVYVDDFWTTTSLVVEVDSGSNGTYSVVWDSTRYEVEPLNGIVDGEAGWPYMKIFSMPGVYFPGSCSGGRRSNVRVTAQWGWPNVPAPIKQATLILAAQTYKLAEAPFGVAGGTEFGVVRVRDLPQVASKIRRYRRNPVLVA